MAAPLADPRDPFQLDRWQRNLPPANSAHIMILIGLQPRTISPSMYLLSHLNPIPLAPTFDVEDFLISRSHTSLPDLRSELRDYLGGLKEDCKTY